MGINCCGPINGEHDQRYRKILWIALGLNALMFVIEIFAAWQAGSTALFADSMDFMADSANYVVTLYALALTPRWRSTIALIKGYTMGLYGVLILAWLLLGVKTTHPPIASIMGIVAVLALIVNCSVAWLLFHFRHGDSNRHAVWLCTRNDAIANITVLIAAASVAFSHSRWPDALVALGIGLLGLWSGKKIIAQAKKELCSFK